MHEIEPFYRWESYYEAARDERSPLHGREANFQVYENDIYGYYIHPSWEYIGSETLYIKILYVEYEQGYAILELMGEWNDALHNDIMHLKRNIIDLMLPEGIQRYVLIAENIFQYHGGDDDYYAEWFEEVEDGWIALVNLRAFIDTEMARYHIDDYVSFGGTLNELEDWRTQQPWHFYGQINGLIQRRLT